MQIADITKHLTQDAQTTMEKLSELCNEPREKIYKCLSDAPDGWWVVERVPGVGCFDYRLRTLFFGYVPRAMKETI